MSAEIGLEIEGLVVRECSCILRKAPMLLYTSGTCSLPPPPHLTPHPNSHHFLIQGQQYSRSCAKCFMFPISFNPHGNPAREGVVHSFIDEKTDSVRSSTFPRVTQMANLSIILSCSLSCRSGGQCGWKQVSE